MEQLCTKCGSTGPFPKDKKRPSGLHTQCKECHRQRIADRRAAEPAKARQQWRKDGRLRRERHPAKVRAAYYRWRDANIERVHEYARGVSRRWYRENRERWIIYKFRRRACKANAAGHATVAQIAARVAFFGGLCAYCKRPFEHIDHVIALSRGGTNWPANLRPACKTCNLTKHTKVWRSVVL